MIQIEIDLLRRLYNGETITLSDLNEDSRAAMRALARRRLVLHDWITSDPGRFVITSLGRRELLAAEDAAKQAADQKAEARAQQEERDRANAFNAAKNKRKQFRHDFMVAAFSVALTLLIEHVDDVVAFFQKIFAVIASLFH